jgi:hypothetical protein
MEGKNDIKRYFYLQTNLVSFVPFSKTDDVAPERPSNRRRLDMDRFDIKAVRSWLVEQARNNFGGEWIGIGLAIVPGQLKEGDGLP